MKDRLAKINADRVYFHGMPDYTDPQHPWREAQA
jgi:hypothetical protein